MKRLNQIEKEMNVLMEEAEGIIMQSKAKHRNLAIAMLVILKGRVRDQFININGDLK